MRMAGCEPVLHDVMGIFLDAGLPWAPGSSCRRGWRSRALTIAVTRHRLGERFGCVPASEKKTLWIHCASVGEVNLANPIVARLKKVPPPTITRVHVSTVTPRRARERGEVVSGRAGELLSARFSADRSGRGRSGGSSPWASSWSSSRSGQLRPPVRGRRTCRWAVVNGRMSERSFGAVPVLGLVLFRPVFRRLAAVGAQNDVYAERLREMGASARGDGQPEVRRRRSLRPAVEERTWRAAGGCGTLRAGRRVHPRPRGAHPGGYL
jgi:hypothetical protein